jgi:hypothetical protein
LRAWLVFKKFPKLVAQSTRRARRKPSLQRTFG